MKTSDDLHRDIQMIVAGHTVEDGLTAQLTSLAASIGFAATDLANADELVDGLAGDLKRTIRQNWDYVRSIRAASAADAGKC